MPVQLRPVGKSDQCRNRLLRNHQPACGKTYTDLPSDVQKIEEESLLREGEVSIARTETVGQAARSKSLGKRRTQIVTDVLNRSAGGRVKNNGISHVADLTSTQNRFRFHTKGGSEKNNLGTVLQK